MQRLALAALCLLASALPSLSMAAVAQTADQKPPASPKLEPAGLNATVPGSHVFFETTSLPAPGPSVWTLVVPADGKSSQWQRLIADCANGGFAKDWAIDLNVDQKVVKQGAAKGSLSATSDGAQKIFRATCEDRKPDPKVLTYGSVFYAQHSVREPIMRAAFNAADRMPPANAKFQHVVKLTTGQDIYMDTAAIRRTGDFVLAWSVMISDFQYTSPNRVTWTRHIFDCALERETGAWLILLNNKMTENDTKQSYQDSMPAAGDMTKPMLNALCKNQKLTTPVIDGMPALVKQFGGPAVIPELTRTKAALDTALDFEAINVPPDRVLKWTLVQANKQAAMVYADANRPAGQPTTVFVLSRALADVTQPGTPAPFRATLATIEINCETQQMRNIANAWFDAKGDQVGAFASGSPWTPFASVSSLLPLVAARCGTGAPPSSESTTATYPAASTWAGGKIVR